MKRLKADERQSGCLPTRRRETLLPCPVREEAAPDRGEEATDGDTQQPPFPSVAAPWARTSSILTLSAVSTGVGPQRSDIHLRTHTPQQLPRRFF